MTTDMELLETPRWKRPGVRGVLIGAAALLLAGAALFVFLALTNGRQAQQIDEEQDKKETAIDQAVANCQAIKLLGGICPADANEIRRGEPAPAPYTDEQVIRIVNDALVQFKRDNPDAVGLGEDKVLEIVRSYLTANPQPGRLPSDDQVRALIRQVIAADPSLRGPAGANGTDGVDGAVGPQGPQGEKGDKGDTGETTCQPGYHFEERRGDELVCIRDAVTPPPDPDPVPESPGEAEDGAA